MLYVGLRTLSLDGKIHNSITVSTSTHGRLNEIFSVHVIPTTVISIADCYK